MGGEQHNCMGRGLESGEGDCINQAHITTNGALIGFGADFVSDFFCTHMHLFSIQAEFILSLV